MRRAERTQLVRVFPSFNDPLWDLFPISHPRSLFLCLPFPLRRNTRNMDCPTENTWPHFHVSQWSNRPEYYKRGSKGFKMFIFDSVCLAVIGKDNDTLVAERVKALWSKNTSISPSSRTKKTWIRSLSWAQTGQMCWCWVIQILPYRKKRNDFFFF